MGVCEMDVWALGNGNDAKEEFVDGSILYQLTYKNSEHMWTVIYTGLGTGLHLGWFKVYRIWILLCIDVCIKVSIQND